MVGFDAADGGGGGGGDFLEVGDKFFGLGGT